MNIADNINTYLNEIGSRPCKLVAISKTKPISLILEAYNSSQRIFGENKVQELVEKHSKLPQDIEWHMVGHLQTNKVKLIAPFIDLIHSVDSFKLLKEIEKQGLKNNRTISCLLQVHIAEEETKFGLTEHALNNLLEELTNSGFQNIKVVGLMGMATYTSDEDVIRTEFRYLREILKNAAARYRNKLIDLNELSIGMSGDYKIAMEEGSTMIRIGTGVFGERF
jgi:pyridoxal phosphate enzyme (YggS family)